VSLETPPAPLGRRVLSWLWDYLVILAWLAIVFLVVSLPQLIGWIDLSPIWTDQNTSDVGITLLTVLPYFIYLYSTEVSDRHATWGKTREGIEVAAGSGASPGQGAVVIRNLVKVLPWQLGHLGTTRLVATEEVTTTALTFEFASLLLLAAIVIPIFFRRRGVHDLLAGTAVVGSSNESGTTRSRDSL
jgi:uncharacterized RDD family membrane protein YckC